MRVLQCGREKRHALKNERIHAKNVQPIDEKNKTKMQSNSESS